MKIVILGDCAINGNNSIGHLIFDDPHIGISWSTAYHFRTKGQLEYFHSSRKEAVKWFLQNKDNQRVNIDDIERIAIKEYTAYVKSKNLKNVVHGEDKLAGWYTRETGSPYAMNEALKLVRKKELENHWSSKLDGHEVTNYAVNGNHYANYLVRLKKHISEYGKPDLVIIGDHAPDHSFIRFTHDNIKYQSILNYTGFMMGTYSSDLGYSEEVYNKKKLLFKKEMQHNQEYLGRKMKFYIKLLNKFLTSNLIKHVHIIYRPYTKQFIDQNYIDMIDIKNSWCHEDNLYLENDHSQSKLATVDQELDLIKQYITTIK